MDEFSAWIAGRDTCQCLHENGQRLPGYPVFADVGQIPWFNEEFQYALQDHEIDMPTTHMGSSTQRLAGSSGCLTWSRILDPTALLKFSNELGMSNLLNWNYSPSLVAQLHQKGWGPVSIPSSHHFKTA